MNPIQRLVELSARCTTKEFSGIPITAQELARQKGQTPEGNSARAVGINMTIGGGPAAIPVSLKNAGEARAAGQVYRKRDAFTDGTKQNVGIIAGSQVGAGIGAGASYAAHGIEQKLAKRAGRDLMLSPMIIQNRALKGAVIGGLAGIGLGTAGGYKWARESNRKRIADNQDQTNLSALDRAKELARGDFAIPALKKIIPITHEGSLLANIGVEGTTTPALRGNAKNVRKAMNKFWGTSAGAPGHHLTEDAEAHMRSLRKWSAQEIRDNKHLLSALDRATELSRKIELGFFSPTKQVPSYNPNGQFAGVKTEANPTGLAADVAVAGGVVGGAALANNAIKNSYGVIGGKTSDAYGAFGKDVKSGFGAGLNPASYPGIASESTNAAAAGKFGNVAGRKVGGLASRIKGFIAGAGKVAAAI